MIAGLPATGKTTTAYAVADQLANASVVDPDQVCFEIYGKPASHMLHNVLTNSLKLAYLAAQIGKRMHAAFERSDVVILPCYAVTNPILRGAIQIGAELENIDVRGVLLTAPRAVVAQRADQRRKSWDRGDPERNNFSDASAKDIDPERIDATVPPSWKRIDATSTTEIIVDQVCSSIGSLKGAKIKTSRHGNLGLAYPQNRLRQDRIAGR